MKIYYSAYHEGLDVNKKIYECSECGKLFNWDEQSSWFGSDYDIKNCPEKIKYFCSDKCKTFKKK
jgi:endogenous inhibitor of DNA gyrase (YacG/DUF329 family)